MSQLKFRFLEQELQSYNKMLGQAADTILDQDVSNYPIFIVHQQDMAAGIPLVEQSKTEGSWSINASTLEEFVTKQLIESEKVNNFRAIYKNPKENLCLFVLSELGATFIFLPRKD